VPARTANCGDVSACRTVISASATRRSAGIQHIDLIRQYRGAGIDLLINGDRNDVETRVLFASDVILHFA